MFSLADSTKYHFFDQYGSRNEAGEPFVAFLRVFLSAVADEVLLSSIGHKGRCFSAAGCD